MFTFRKISIALLITIMLVAGMGFSATPALAANCSSYHVVRRGESLSWIARYYGVYWPYLAQINGIRAPRYTVFVGQTLCIANGGTGYYPNNGYNGYNNYNGYWNVGTGGRQYNTTGTYWSFAIVDVQQDANITINTNNFPSNVMFNVKVGRQSGSGYDWVDMPNLDSGNGGSFKAVVNIPPAFSGVSQLVVRLIQQKKNGKSFQEDQWVSNVSGSYGTGGRGYNYGTNYGYNNSSYNYNPYNYNNNGYGYHYIPTIWISSVNRNSTVTVQTRNFPANTDFQVLMGPMGTHGFGFYVSTFNSGAGGSMSLTFPIPSQLYGSYQVSIRTQNQWSGYYSYNWFYNNTTY
jgi:LysM repeat protein